MSRFSPWSNKNEYSADDDNDDDSLPPRAGLFSKPTRSKRLVIDEPSSDEDSQHSSEDMKDNDGSDWNLSCAAFDKLAISSKSHLEDSKPEKDGADACVEEERVGLSGKFFVHQSHIQSMDDSLVSTSEEEGGGDDDRSTLAEAVRLKTLDDDEHESSCDECTLNHGDVSTVIQEDRAKTPNRKPAIDLEREASTDDDGYCFDASIIATTVVQDKGRINTPKYKSALTPAEVYSSLSKSNPDGNEGSAVVVKGPNETRKKKSVIFVDSSPDSSLETQKASSKPNKKLGRYSDASAWALDSERDEYFLTSGEFHIRDGQWPELRIPSDLFQRLYHHQKGGVQWMASLFSNRIGGILGDDMGMGKTYQTLAYLGGLMRAGTIRNALVVAPLSVLRSWEREAKVVIQQSCAPRIVISVVTSELAKTRRLSMIRPALSCPTGSPYLVITTYGLIQSSTLDFVSEVDDWDVVVLDEGQIIKNTSTKVSKACRRICESRDTRRIMLTGTPIQNNLKELWALFDWATSGKVLGKLKSFDTNYGKPIEDGRNKNAGTRTVEIAEKANIALQEKLRPYFLQRMKQDFMKDELPTKCELVVWTHLSPKQRKMYEMYIGGEKVASVLAGDVKSPLEAITWLKKLCGHPLLVDSTGQYDRHTSVNSRRPDDLLRESAKLEVLVALVERIRSSGHRTLIFSQSTKMLDIIERVLTHVRLSRIDGATREKDRQAMVEAFNDELRGPDAMLLSTKAAGLGLTLTGADRAVIYDPSWNPAEDAQAVDRCYRIGQTKNVTVYRLISAGSVEEKMYEKQVHKDGIRRAVMTNAGNATERYFNKKDLRKLFTLAPAGVCEVLEKIQAGRLAALGSSGKPTFLESHLGVVGVSSHDGIYALSESQMTSASEWIGTPFGGTLGTIPRVIGRSQRALMSKRRINFSAADKENSKTETVQSSATKTPNDNESLPPAAKDIVDAALGQVDSLKAAGDLVGAMSILLDLVESPPADKKQKLRVHQGLAEIGSDLGWLNETTA